MKFGSSPSWTVISDTWTTRPAGWNPSRTASDQSVTYVSGTDNDLIGAPALMKLITTFPLPHSDILATDAQFRPRISKARQNHYDPPAEHSGFGGPQFVRSVTGECSSSNGPA